MTSSFPRKTDSLEKGQDNMLYLHPKIWNPMGSVVTEEYEKNGKKNRFQDSYRQKYRIPGHLPGWIRKVQDKYMTDTFIFDFDGTLADTTEVVIRSMKLAMARLGIMGVSDEQLRSGIGLCMEDYAKVCGNLPDDKVEEAVRTYKEIYHNLPESEKRIQLFEGVAETLSMLKDKGMKLAIATSRGKNSLEEILSSHGISELFDTKITAYDGFKPKPAPDMVLEILERLGSSPENSIMVGDTTFDLDMGKSAGCLTCGVTYGNHDREKLAGCNPDRIIDSFKEILSFVK